MNLDYVILIFFKMFGLCRIFFVVVVRYCVLCRECYEGFDGISRRFVFVWV